MGVSVKVGRTVPGPGVTGVLVGGRVAVAVTILTGIKSRSPTAMAILFDDIVNGTVEQGGNAAKRVSCFDKVFHFCTFY